jgi:hypothetical protein
MCGDFLRSSLNVNLIYDCDYSGLNLNSDIFLSFPFAFYSKGYTLNYLVMKELDFFFVTLFPMLDTCRFAEDVFTFYSSYIFLLY